MNAAAWFEAVEAVDGWVAPAAAFAFLLLPRPRRFWLRCVVAVLVGWALALAFTLLVYNPAGVAAAHAAGDHFSEVRYDNNTFAVSLLGGWLVPTVLVGLYALARQGWLRSQRRGA